MNVAVVGGSGYVGGELVRLLLGHPDVTLTQVTSESSAGKPVARTHPNLRRATNLSFVPRAELQPADVTFLATPHGESMGSVPELLSTGGTVVDLSADHRLRDPKEYPRYYGREHPHPELLGEAVYGLPELHREAIRRARLVAVPGCIATATILALHPVARAYPSATAHAVVDAKSGSSASGHDAGPAGQHAERSGVMRVYAPAGHRHTAEVEQETGVPTALSCHAVEAVRGVLSTVHLLGVEPPTERDLWKVYRSAYGAEPFVRIVHDADGLHREPEPKILSGTNYCDVGFAADRDHRRTVLLGAIDNLGKGAAGAAVQCFNVRHRFPEERGLGFLGLHPI
ncbi:MAG TPA: N-acetyl-gamma-glutamyl-phosphate reductase [Thermoplasmata archaeon]|nr:N-acetyl-gamma-glutamyl-phosphate reductase [Thermoplasmata archaeon]